MLLSSHRFCVLAALAATAALAGCDNSEKWFAKPFDVSGRSAGYSFSELAETKKQQRTITPNDLVSASGACPAPAAPATPPPAAASAGGAPAGSTPPAAPGGDASSLLGGGIALGMSECDVVNRAGPPSSVQIGSSPNGDRTTTLTFQGGPRPGIYRFLRGSLTEMDAVAEPAPQPQVARKKPAGKPKKSAQN